MPPSSFVPHAAHSGCGGDLQVGTLIYERDLHVVRTPSASALVMHRPKERTRGLVQCEARSKHMPRMQPSAHGAPHARAPHAARLDGSARTRRFGSRTQRCGMASHGRSRCRCSHGLRGRRHCCRSRRWTSIPDFGRAWGRCDTNRLLGTTPPLHRRATRAPSLATLHRAISSPSFLAGHSGCLPHGRAPV
jgi:hypothetical protein